MKQILDFISDLRANNNRPWFADNKERYQDVRRQTELLADALIAGLTVIEPRAASLTPSACLYRIYRDTRFSSDKTPFKNHIGIYMNPYGGKKSQFGGYYLHLEPGNCLVAGGVWCPTVPVLKAVRRSIYDNTEEYLDIIGSPEFSKTFPVVGEDLLKTAPKGFPADWEHIALLRPRSYTATSIPLDEKMSAPHLADTALKYFRILKPFNDFLNYTFEENPGLPRFF